jgi:hypothetical protein
LSTFADSPPSGRLRRLARAENIFAKIRNRGSVGDERSKRAYGQRKGGGAREFSAADRRKPLKRLNYDKAIQGNPSPCISVRGSSWMFGRAQFVLVEQ